MRKQNVLFGLASLAVLSSCLGPEIVDTAEVGNIRDSIAFQKTEIENYELRLNYKSVTKDETNGGKEVTTTEHAVLRSNADGEFSAEVSVGEKGQNKYYLVNDEEHLKVLYYSFFHEGSAPNVYAYSLKQSKTDFERSYYDDGLARMKHLPEVLIDPYVFEEEKSKIFGLIVDDDDYNKLTTETKYYSKGEGNLTIKAVDTLRKDRKTTTEVYELSYDNFAFTSAKIKANYPDGSSWECGFFLEQKEEVEITLPTGWERYLETAELL
jgi:hypothetical protein